MIRTYCPVPRNVTLRFLSPSDEPAPDGNYTDMLHFNLPPSANRGTVGKYLLLNAFLRYASMLHYAFVARMDDDALVNVSAVSMELSLLDPERHKHIVVGPVMGNWYMWHQESMQPSCKAGSQRRFMVHRRVARENTSLAHHLECAVPGLAGPFLFSGGGFTAYSQALVRELVPMFGSDERHVLQNITLDRAIYNPFKGRTYGVNSTSRHHPASMILLEDVYYSSLIHRAFGTSNRRLLLIHLKLVNWRPAPYRNGTRHLRDSIGSPAVIYHSLKSPKRFAAIANSSLGLLQYGEPYGLRCSARLLGADRAMCCRNWTMCRVQRRRAGLPFGAQVGAQPRSGR